MSLTANFVHEVVADLVYMYSIMGSIGALVRAGIVYINEFRATDSVYFKSILGNKKERERNVLITKIIILKKNYMVQLYK